MMQYLVQRTRLCVMHDCIVFFAFRRYSNYSDSVYCHKKHFRFLRFLVKFGKIEVRTQL